MKTMKIIYAMQNVVFALLVILFVVTFVGHTVMALASHRWGMAIVMGVISVSSVVVIKSAIDEIKHTKE